MKIAGNWKMNMTRSSAEKLVQGIKSAAQNQSEHAETIIFPPSILIDTVIEAIDGAPIRTGGQDCHDHSSGAFTGDISAEMIADSGCDWVLLGHSERRTLHGEDSPLICRKVKTAQQSGLKTMICVGETLEERDAGKANAVVQDQLVHSMPEDLASNRFAIAYEPVWAIGTGRVASAEDVAAMHDYIRSVLIACNADYRQVDILYGGSVKPENAQALMALENVGGVLVGGASLKSEDFSSIIMSAS